MSAMFYVLSLLLYAKARLAEKKWRKRVLFAGCILAGIFSFGSKEIAATLPFFIFLYEWYFHRDLSRRRLRRHILPITAVLLLFTVVALIYLGVHPLEKILNDYNGRNFTLAQRVLTEFRVVVFYISQLVFPHPSRLNLDHDFMLSRSLTDPFTTLLSIGVIVGLVGLTVYLAKRERLLSFCILWFLGNLVIESSVIGLEIIFEHRTYLPSMLVILMAVMLVFRYAKPNWLGISGLCVVVMVFSFWTYQRNSVWGDDVELWLDSAKKSPDKARPHYNLGVALASRGRFEEAIGHFSEALRIKPDYAVAHNNLGNVLASQGKIGEAVVHYSHALRIDPDHAKAHNNLGLALASQGKPEEAMGHFSEALRITPDDAEAHNVLGNALTRQGKIEEAMGHYFEALRIKPDYAGAHNNLGNALANRGKFGEAVVQYSQALHIDPDNAEAHNNLGLALASQGKLEEASVHFSEALRITPDYADAHNNAGHALARRGKLNEAVSHYFEALRIRPDYAKAHNNLGAALASQGKLEEAMVHFSEALRIKPDDAQARRNLEHVLQRIGKP
jgi:Flp pilus assembly protein TadD